MRRRHPVVTVPSGVLLFACIALPGYRECEHNTAMYQDPILILPCVIGLVIALSALAFSLAQATTEARRRTDNPTAPITTRGSKAELGFSIASLILSIGIVGLFVFGILITQVFAGITVGTVLAVGLVFGTILWIREVIGKPLGSSLTVGAIVLAVGLGVVAARSTWHPPPNKTLDFDLHLH